MVRNEKGFTMVELLTVIAIITLLCAVLGMGLRKIMEQSAVKRARVEMRTVMNALEQYHEKYGTYPPAGNQNIVTCLKGKFGLKLFNASTKRWLDPWNQPYVYELQNGEPVLRSWGPDMEGNTDDDLVAR